ncbi:MAG TPA: DUF2064 domain-containing protein [Mycobacteriales bacterium]|nr:DUF2064 domain-containing protein [Mycobacteriales bacterium]
MTLAVQLLVLAKEPVPGRVKTRLCPPLTPAQAADVAAAALADTLDAVRATPVARRVLVTDGTLGAEGFARQPQCSGPLDERLAAAFDDAAAASDLPALLIGMDTPQVSPALLGRAAGALTRASAVLGRSVDGGWWALGLQRPDGALLRGVPTSRGDTGQRQLARLRAAGLSPVRLPVLCDVDTAADAVAVARRAPGSRFARVLGEALSAPAARAV